MFAEICCDRREQEVLHLRSMVTMGSELRDSDRSALASSADLVLNKEQEVVRIYTNIHKFE